MHRPTVLIAEDHTMVMEGLVLVLREQFDVVGAVSDGPSLLEAAKRHRPDVIVTDISMPGLSGLDVLRHLREDRAAVKVIMLTMHADASIATEAIRAGASGFILKHSAGEELVNAVHEVLRGRVYLTPAVTKDVIAQIAASGRDQIGQLTLRQREVLKLVADGRRIKEIAAILGLSARTVESHKYEMMQALGVQSTAELVRYAIQNGLIAE